MANMNIIQGIMDKLTDGELQALGLVRNIQDTSVAKAKVSVPKTKAGIVASVNLTPTTVENVVVPPASIVVEKTVKAEKKASGVEYVAYRVNLADSSPKAKKVRVAGSVEYLTAHTLKLTLNTWIKGDNKVEEQAFTIDNIIAGVNGSEFRQGNTFIIYPMTHTNDLSDKTLYPEMIEINKA